MTHWGRRRLIIKAIRQGLATDIKCPSNMLDRTGVEFMVPGGIKVIVCCERRSLQCFWPDYSHHAIGFTRAARRVLRELEATGWIDPAPFPDPWQELKHVTEVRS